MAEQQNNLLSAIEDFNRKNVKPLLNVTNMLEDFNYPILYVARSETQYGARIKIELFDEILYIPEWWNEKITDEEIERLNSSDQYYIKKLRLANGGYDLDFIKSELKNGYKNQIRKVNMIDNKSYPILRMRRTEVLQVDVLDNVIFLADKFIEISNRTIDEINEKSHCLRKTTVAGIPHYEIYVAPKNIIRNDILEHELKNLNSQSSPSVNLKRSNSEECQNIQTNFEDKRSKVENEEVEELQSILKIEPEQILHENHFEGNFNVITENTSRNSSPIKLNSDSEKNLNIEKFLCLYDNDTILLSDDDNNDEEDDDLSENTAERNETSSPSNDKNNETQTEGREKIKYKCTICPKKSITKSEKSMYKHMQKYHGLNNIENCQKIIYNQKKVLCQHCNNSYSFLSAHIKKMHPTKYMVRRKSIALNSNVQLTVETDPNQATYSPHMHPMVWNNMPPYIVPPKPEFCQDMSGGPITPEEHATICQAMYIRQHRAALLAQTAEANLNFYETH